MWAVGQEVGGQQTIAEAATVCLNLVLQAGKRHARARTAWGGGGGQKGSCTALLRFVLCSYTFPSHRLMLSVRDNCLQQYCYDCRGGYAANVRTVRVVFL